MNVTTRVQRRTAWLLTCAGFLVIAATTLVPIPQQAAAARATPVWCLVCGDLGGVDVLNNLLLFIPFAAGLRLLGLRAPVVTMMGALLSLAIESLQLSIIPGRDAALSDLLTNTLGSWIGATLITYRTQILDPGSARASRLAILGALAWWVVQFGTAVLLRPWVPSSELRTAWARAVPGREPFNGRVTSAVVSGVPVSRKAVALSPEVAERIRQGRVHLELAFTSGGAASWSPLFEILARSGSVVSVEAVGRDLAFQPPARSSALRLRRPALRLEEALLPQRNLPVRLAAGERSDTLWAVWTAAGVRHSSFQVLSPSFGWSLVTPVWYAYGSEASLLTGLWLVVWLLPTGYWSARIRTGGASRIWLLAVVPLVGLGIIPRLMGYSPVHWSEWLAGFAGLGIGRAGGRSAAISSR
jgi:VanZ like family